MFFDKNNIFNGTENFKFKFIVPSHEEKKSKRTFLSNFLKKKNNEKVDKSYSIQKYAFSQLTGLHSIDLTNVEIINPFAFKNCINLKEIIIPESVTHIGRGVFEGCKKLTSITFNKPEPPTFLKDWEDSKRLIGIHIEDIDIPHVINNENKVKVDNIKKYISEEIEFIKNINIFVPNNINSVKKYKKFFENLIKSEKAKIEDNSEERFGNEGLDVKPLLNLYDNLIQETIKKIQPKPEGESTVEQEGESTVESKGDSTDGTTGGKKKKRSKRKKKSRKSRKKKSRKSRKKKSRKTRKKKSRKSRKSRKKSKSSNYYSSTPSE